MATSKGTVANINSMMNIRLLFGFYHNVYDCNYKRYLMKILFLIFGGFCVYKAVMFETSRMKETRVVNFVRIVEYVIYFICSLRTADEYLFKYYSVDMIDKKIFLKSMRRKFNIIFPCYCLVCFVMHIILSLPLIFNCFVSCQQIGFTLIYVNGIRIANEVGRLPIMMTFTLFYFRVKIFCKNINEEVLNNSATTVNWKQYVINYTKMLESLKKTDWPIKLMMIVHLASGFIHISAYQLYMAKLLKNYDFKDYMKLSLGVAHLIYYYAVLFFPSIIMEMISEHINNLKTDIANRVITCTDERRRANLRQLLKYFRDQPLKYCIWRAIPVDSRLPLHYISLSATYLVCLMQLTHLLED